MQTTKLKRFATEARNMLRKGVERKLDMLGLSVNARSEMQQNGDIYILNGRQVSSHFAQLWQEIKRRIDDNGPRQVIEEAAYTWFNRLMAIRILQMNGLIEPVLRSADSVGTPAILVAARDGIFPPMDDADRQRLIDLLDDDTLSQEQFALLINAWCHANPVVNSCFGAAEDWTELLVPEGILMPGGFISTLNDIDFIDDEDYKSPELIGWLYQFYIAERKDEVFAKKGKYDADEIAPATQIFTPNWIVKYMVQNTVGRIYLDNNPSEKQLAENWKYLVEPSDSEATQTPLKCGELQNLKVADLACGSGHILNECFDLLYELYLNEGYSRRDAITNIFTRNLTGIDIDLRAKQLATFALMLKACQRDASFTDAHCLPRVYNMPKVDRYTYRDTAGHFDCAYQIRLTPSSKFHNELDEAFTLMENADCLGSVMKFNISHETREYLANAVAEYEREPKYDKAFAHLIDGYKMILALTENYNSIVMNPPYMGNHNMPEILKNYVDQNYSLTANDLGAVFIEVAAHSLHGSNSYFGIINQAAWLFKPSYLSFRKELIDNNYLSLSSLLYLGPHTFDEIKGEVVQSVCFIGGPFCGCKTQFYYLKQYPTSTLKQLAYLNKEVKPIKRHIHDFALLSGKQFGFWLNQTLIETCNNSPISLFGCSKQGLKTGDNPRFIRLWHEVSNESFKRKWFPVETGGYYRKWYGNHSSVLEWENDGFNLKNFKDENGKLKSRPQGLSHAFTNGLTWSTSATDNPSFRYSNDEFLFESSGSKFFCNNEEYLYLFMAFFNSPVSKSLVEVFSPGLGISEGAIKLFPFILPNDWNEISKFSTQSTSISKEDWDAHETSWDFQGNEIAWLNSANKYIDIVNGIYEGTDILVDLAASQLDSIEWRTDLIKSKWTNKFERLHANEEELNRRFIEIYGLQDELNPHVDYEDITILQQGEISLYRPTHGTDAFENQEDAQKYGTILEDDDIVIAKQSVISWNDDVLMKQLISYGFGCMEGRYRLDRPGLAIAHQNPTSDEIASYDVPETNSTFWIDDDGIIPVLPSDCGFHDNAVQHFVDFVRVVFGEEKLNENLNYIEKCLGKTIEQYFLKDFWKDHKKMYQNRPIYWLFSSKKGAFQALVYVHRMTPYTAERVRFRYLLPYIERMKQQIKDLEERDSKLTTAEQRTLDTLRKQVDECQEYHDILNVVADQAIPIDLDAGILANYANYSQVLAKLK